MEGFAKMEGDAKGEHGGDERGINDRAGLGAVVLNFAAAEGEDVGVGDADVDPLGRGDAGVDHGGGFFNRGEFVVGVLPCVDDGEGVGDGLGEVGAEGEEFRGELGFGAVDGIVREKNGAEGIDEIGEVMSEGFGLLFLFFAAGFNGVGGDEGDFVGMALELGVVKIEGHEL